MLRLLRLHNFKSINSVEIEFEPLTVLVGRSGTGKTNVVEGIRFWRDYLVTRSWDMVNRDWSRFLFAGGQHTSFGASFGFEVPGTAGRFYYSLSFDVKLNQFDNPSLLFEYLSIGDRVLFEQRAGKWTVPPAVLNAPSPGNLALGAVRGLQDATTAFTALTQGIGCYDFEGTVLKPMANSTSSPLRGLDDRGQNFIDVFSGIEADLSSVSRREIIAALKVLHPTVSTLDRGQHGHNIMHVGHSTSGGNALTLELAQQSEGFRRFLAHLLALYQVPSKLVLIFEEAEKGIYPGALSVLAEHFKAVVERGNTQIIMTTHSPQLLDHFAPESIRVVKMVDYSTRVGKLAPEQHEALKQSLLTAGELLTADPARMAEPV